MGSEGMTQCKYQIERTIDLPQGGSVTVTVSSSEPINEADYMVFRPGVATSMAECLTDLANALRPLNSPEII